QPPPTRLRRLPRRAAGGEHAPALDRLHPVAPRRRGVGAAVARPRAAGRAAAPGAARARPRPRARRPPLRADGDERRAVHASGPAGLRAVRRVRAGGAGTGPRVVPRAPRPRAARQAGAPVRGALHPPADGLRAVVARGARRAAWSGGAGPPRPRAGGGAGAGAPDADRPLRGVEHSDGELPAAERRAAARTDGRGGGAGGRRAAVSGPRTLPRAGGVRGGGGAADHPGAPARLRRAPPPGRRQLLPRPGALRPPGVLRSAAGGAGADGPLQRRGLARRPPRAHRAAAAPDGRTPRRPRLERARGGGLRVVAAPRRRAAAGAAGRARTRRLRRPRDGAGGGGALPDGGLPADAPRRAVCVGPPAPATRPSGGADPGDDVSGRGAQAKTVQRGGAVVIGAGPAGLTAAYELRTRTDLPVTVFEATGALGGISQTVVYRRNRMDIGGHRFFSKSDRVLDWWLAMIPPEAGGAQALAYQGKTTRVALDGGAPIPPEAPAFMLRERSSRIFFAGQFFDYPIRLTPATLRTLGPRRAARIGASYLRSTLSPFREPQNLEEFFINRFGRELYETFFRDYTEKVWGAPCSEIPADWGAQRVKGLSIGSALRHFVRGLVGRDGGARQKGTETSLIEQFLYPRRGPGEMWEVVAARVAGAGGAIRMRHRVDRLRME